MNLMDRSMKSGEVKSGEVKTCDSDWRAEADSSPFHTLLGALDSGIAR